jgi:hypothetical protein
MGSTLSGVVNISHLLFVDDTLIFCGVKLDHLRNLMLYFYALKLSLD